MKNRQITYGHAWRVIAGLRQDRRVGKAATEKCDRQWSQGVGRGFSINLYSRWLRSGGPRPRLPEHSCLALSGYGLGEMLMGWGETPCARTYRRLAIVAPLAPRLTPNAAYFSRVQNPKMLSTSYRCPATMHLACNDRVAHSWGVPRILRNGYPTDGPQRNPNSSLGSPINFSATLQERKKLRMSGRKSGEEHHCRGKGHGTTWKGERKHLKAAVQGVESNRCPRR